MSDLHQRIIEILRHPQLACLATITLEGKPWVRYVFIEGTADRTIRFASFLNSRKVTQIKSNPEVHLTCGATDPAKMNPYLQIQGQAAVITDQAERRRFWKDSLFHYFQGPDDPNYCVVVVKPYLIELCSPGSFEPQVWGAGTN